MFPPFVKKYDVIRFYEIEVSDDFVLPFFEIESDGHHYDSRSMSTGELSALYLAWAVQSTEPGTILLIEEPEAFLPPASHAAAFHLISIGSVKRQLSFVMTTHSCEVADQFASRSIVSIRNAKPKNIIAAQNETKERILYRLGLKPQKSAILLLEDRLAEIICDEILSQFDLTSFCNIELIARSGHGNVRNTLSGLPSDISSVKFIGVLDGDVKLEALTWDITEKLVFLPFENYMEMELTEAISNDIVAFGRASGRPVVKIEDILHETEILEYHDRFTQLSEKLRISPEELARLAFRRWQRQRGNGRAVRKFAQALANAVGVPLD